MQLTGIITQVFEPRSGVSARTGNSWKSQEYVIETIESRPRHLCFTVKGEEKIKQFNIQKGEELAVDFDIDAHEYQGRWFNEVTCWRVTREGR